MSASPVTTGVEVAEQLQSRVCAFVRTAHDNGYPVGVAEELEAQRLLTLIDVTDRWQFYASFKALLCSNRAQWDGFDALFEGFWRSSVREARVSAQQHAPASRAPDTPHPSAGQGGNASEADTTGKRDSGAENENVPDGATLEGASVQERLAGLDFQFINNTEQQRAIEELAERLARNMRRKPARRQRDESDGSRLNMRQTLRQSLQYGGLPLQLSFQQRRLQQPRLVVIVDVSRSMSIYSSIFLRFARGLVGAFRDIDAFACHTRLVHITEALRKPDLVMMKHHLALISQGWSGGTRLGECLDDFNERYGRAVNRRSVVVVLSDGLDTGPPEQLVAAVTHLQARCRRLVWLNPLLGRVGYETRTRAMSSVVPLLDVFAPAHNLQSLAALETQLINL